jgi:hypothetical protein
MSAADAAIHAVLPAVVAVIERRNIRKDVSGYRGEHVQDRQHDGWGWSWGEECASGRQDEVAGSNHCPIAGGWYSGIGVAVERPGWSDGAAYIHARDSGWV